eukprot:2384852-Pyramimonas_sp.AAC.4
MGNGERFGLFNKTEWYGTDEGWWLRLVMASIIVIAVYINIKNCTEGSINKRLRDQKSREARSYHHLAKETAKSK